MKKLYVFIFFIFSVIPLFSQQYQWVNQWSGLSEEVAVDVVVDQNNNHYVGGFFGNTLDLSSSTFTSEGFRDGFLIKYDATGQEVWHQQLGSILDDEVKKVGIDDQNHLYVLINHNDSLFIQGDTIFSTSYWSVLKFDDAGNLLLHFNPFVAIPIHFSLADMAVNEQGNIALSGSFGLANMPTETRLEIGSDTLFTFPRKNFTYVQQMWVATYDRDGQYLWSKATRATGFTGATGGGVDFDRHGEVVVGGVFSFDNLQPQDIDFGDATVSLTGGQGRSVFAVRYDGNGNFLWADAISAESVFPGFPGELDLSTLHCGAYDDIYLGGRFTGEITFGNDTISTPVNGLIPAQWPYLARFKQNQPDWILPFKGSQMTSPFLTVIDADANGQVYAGGVFLDSLTIGSQVFAGTQDLYLAAFDTTGQLDWVETVQGDDSQGIAVLFNGLASSPSGTLSFCGALDAPGTFGSITLTEPSGTSCCLNAFVAFYADSCAALTPQAGFAVEADSLDPQKIQFSTTTGAVLNAVSWDFGEGRTSNLRDPELRYFVPGPYQVCQVVTNDCGTDTFCQTIFVNCEVEADFSQLEDSTNLRVDFTNLSTNANQYFWDFGDGTNATAVDTVHQFPDPNPYTVTLIAFGDCGVDTAVKTVIPLCEPGMADFTFSNDTTNLTIQFDNLSQNMDAYLWDFGDGTTDTSVNPIHQFPFPDTFTVTMIGVGPCVIDTIAQSVIATCDSTVADFSFAADTTNLTIQFTNTSLNGQDFFWDFGDGTGDTVLNPIHQFPFPDTFDVTLLVFGPCEIDTFHQQVIATCDPTTADFSFASDTTNLTISFSNLSTNGASYVWDFGDGSSDTAANPIHQFPAAGLYDVSLITFGPCETDTLTLQVGTACEPTSAGFSVEIDTTNLRVSFTNLSVNADQIAWDFGDGNGSSDPDPVYQYTFPDTFTVTLIAYGPCVTDTIQKQVIAKCLGTKAGFTYATDSLALAVDFNNLSINAQQYSWDFGDGNGSSDAEPMHTYSAPNFYEATLIAFGTCQVDTFRQVIRPDCNVPVISLSAILDTSNLSYSLSVDLGGNTTFFWDFGSGIGDSLSLNPLVTFPAPGLYTITFSVSNLCGTAIYQTQLYVPPLSVSVESLEPVDFQWRVYPNPAQEVWWLEKLAGPTEPFSLELVNLQGQVMLRKDYFPQSGERVAIPASKLPFGYYWLRVMGENGMFTFPLQKN